MWGTLQRDNVDPAVRRALEKIKEGRQEGWWEGKKGGKRNQWYVYEIIIIQCKSALSVWKSAVTN